MRYRNTLTSIIFTSVVFVCAAKAKDPKPFVPAARALAEQAIALDKQNKSDQAITLLKQAIQKDPEQQWYHTLLADIYLNTSQFSKSANEWRLAIAAEEKDTNSPRIKARMYRYLAVAFDSAGNTGEADKAFKQSTALIETDPETWEWYCRFLKSHGRTQEYERARAKYEETKNYWMPGD